MAGAVCFSGSWVVDKSRSDTLESILRLMGVPWLAVQVVLALDVTTDIAHDPTAGRVATTDRTSLGVLSSNEVLSDGVQVARVGKDGRTALLTCSVGAGLPQGFAGRALPPPAARDGAALAYLRITTLLPDGEGVSDNVWEMRGGGRVMQAFTTFTKGGRVARASRVLVNKAWQAGLVPQALPLPPPPLLPPPPPLPPLPLLQGPAGDAFLSPLPHAGSGAGELDPFFVSLGGAWVEADRSPTPALGLVGEPLALIAAGLAAALRPPAPARQAASGRAALTIAHAAGARTVRLSCPELWGDSARGGGRLGSLDLALDGKWRWHAGTAVQQQQQQQHALALVRAVQAEGQGDLGPAWLGHELGFLSQAEAALPPPQCQEEAHAHALLPHFSAAEFDPELYTRAEVRVEVLLPAAGQEEGGGVDGELWGAAGGAEAASRSPRGSTHTLILRGDGWGRVLWLGIAAGASGEGARAAGEGGAAAPALPCYPAGLRWCCFVRRQGEAPSAASERARQGGVRAALLLRRAQADGQRRRSALDGAAAQPAPS